MCPKAKSDRVQTHRIELQQTERDAFEMLAASMAARNLAEGVGSLVTPFTTATIPGVILWGSIAAAILVEIESWTPGAQVPIIGDILGANATQPFRPKADNETQAEYRQRTAWYDRVKYGMWDKPISEIKALVTEGEPIPTPWD